LRFRVDEERWKVERHEEVENSTAGEQGWMLRSLCRGHRQRAEGRGLEGAGAVWDVQIVEEALDMVHP
jgi:hypothetical protein